MTEVETSVFGNPMTLSAALLARGFLVEAIGCRIYLTDNAYLYRRGYPHERNFPSDPEFLAENLERMGLDGLSRNTDGQRPFRLNHQDQTLSQQQISILFDYRHIGGEASYDYGQDTHEYFRRRIHGLKVPTAALDPHIALLIKAFSAVGCFSFSSCEGELASSRHGVCALHVSFVGQINADWAGQLIQHARDAGVQLPALSVDTAKRHLEETLSNKPGAPRNISHARRQAIDLGRFLYDRRINLRQMRAQWMEHVQPSETEVSAPKTEIQQAVEFRVRLSDSTGFFVEFTIDGFRALEKRCRTIFETWLELNPEGKRKGGRFDWFNKKADETEASWLQAQGKLRAVERSLSKEVNDLSQNEALALMKEARSLKEQADRFSDKLRLLLTPVLQIQVATPSEQEWRTPWGDSKPVRIRLARSANADSPKQWSFLIRRTSVSGKTATSESWLLLWMGFREAFKT